MGVRYRMIGALGVLAVVLVGCTSGGADAPGSSPVPTPTSQVTSGPTTASTGPSPVRSGPLTTGPNMRPGEKPPVLLAVGRQRTQDGALEFASYFFQSLDWAYATNDAYLLRKNSEPSCTACQSIVGGIARTVAAGKSIHGGRLVVDAVRVDHHKYSRLSSDVILQVDFKQQPIHIDDSTSTSSPPDVGANSKLATSLLFVDWLSGRWVVSHLSNGQQS